MNLKNILLSCVSCVVLTGCYTQLAMFYPEPEIEQDEEQFYETYSRAVPRPVNVNIYAQTGAGSPLGLAYQMMYNRFNGMYTNWGSHYGSGYYNKYDYYNRYGYHAGYNGYDTYLLGGYTMYIPVKTGERKQRTFSTSRGDNGSSGTNLNITRSNHIGYNGKNNNNSYGNSSNVSSNRGSSGGSSSSSSSSSSGGRRATRRN